MLVMGTFKCTWWAGLVCCATVGWRLGKSLYGFPSGIIVGVYGLYEGGLRGGMGSLIDDVNIFYYLYCFCLCPVPCDSRLNPLPVVLFLMKCPSPPTSLSPSEACTALPLG